jgi:hypothetical protein
MSADRFETRVADWLEDGPDAAPRGIEAASLEHARTHPRSRRAIVLRRVAPYGRSLAAAGVVLAVAGTLVLGFARSRDLGSPVAPVTVRGSETCAVRVLGMVLSTTEQGQARLQGRITVCDEGASDPRVRGELSRWVTADLFDADPTYPDGTSNHYGQAELRGEGGTWAGPFVATHLGRTEPVLEGRLSWIGLGSGAYAGLVYRMTVTTDASLESTIAGTIESIGEAATASTWCLLDSPTSPGVFEPVDGVRSFARTCTITSDDVRLAGAATEHRTITVDADGTAIDRGTLEIATADGGWTGTFSGTGDWSMPGDITGTLDGRGALAGASVRFRVLSEDGMHGAMVAEFSSAP